MKTRILLIASLLLNLQVQAYHSLIISNPQQTWGKRTLGIITQPIIEVTPMGAFAQIEMIFTINADQSNSAADSLEAVLNFDLPANSFIHDSWLWLDNTHIIKADVVEKNRAISIYESIVRRRRDPSLLIKTGSYSYQLSVYPMTTNYPRKIKLVYSVPVNWQENRVNLPLPLELLNSSQTLPDLLLKINYNNRFNSPGLSAVNMSNYITGSTANQYTLVLPPAAYKNACHVIYNISLSNGLYVNTYSPGGNSDGYFEMVIQPSATGAAKPRNLVFVIDHSYQGIYNYAATIELLKSSLHNHYNKSDSFNLFTYNNNGTIYKSFANWQSIDSANIESAVMSTTNIINNATITDLLKHALAFCKSKPGDDAQVILISDNSSLSSNQQDANAAFNNIKSHIGAFENKVHIINNSAAFFNSSAGMLAGNELLYNKLALASGGNHYKSDPPVYHNVSNKQLNLYNLNIGNLLKEISLFAGTHTGSFNIDPGITNGFAYSRSDINGINRFNVSGAYVETGKFYGSLIQGNTVSIQASTPAGYINQQQSIGTVDNGSDHIMRSWVYKYICTLEGLNNPNFANEIIDSSVNNRVLCNYTAFLAVETGDTILTNTNNNPSILVINSENLGMNSMKCYPNPFINNLTIELDFDATTIEIVDLLGQKIFSAQLKNGTRKYVWNGTGSSGTAAPAGFYIIIAKSETAIKTMKVMKQ